MTREYEEFDELLGPALKKSVLRPRVRGDKGPAMRPRQRHKVMAAPDLQAREERVNGALERILRGRKPTENEQQGELGYDAEGGVTLFWLAKAFGMEVSTVRKKLADCPWLRKKTSGYTYSLAEAAKRLVPPIVDVETHIKQMKPGELPEALRAAYWDAQLKRQKWEANAGHLWHSVDVIEVLGDAFQTIKSTIDLWIETLERTTGVSDEQRLKLEGMADALQDEIQDKLVAGVRRRSTLSSLKDHPANALNQNNNEEDDYAYLL